MFARLIVLTVANLSIHLTVFCGHGRVNEKIVHNKAHRTIAITVQNGDMKMLIDYSKGCSIKRLSIKGKNTLSPSGVVTGIKGGNIVYTSEKLSDSPLVQINNNVINISRINYGEDISIQETWIFEVEEEGITWELRRSYADSFEAEEMYFPKWNFADLSVWKGGIIDNGGMVWCKYLKNINDSYGVHTGGTTYWNDSSGDGLSIQGAGLAGTQIASQYSHSPQGEFTCTQFVTNTSLTQRHHLNRFVSKKPNVFAPFKVEKGEISARFTIKYIDYFKLYDRGDLKTINAAAVRELLNTTARYGVVDNNIVGGNGWLTNWKCIHEPFFAQIATALADSNYTKNLSSTLDQERDMAILPDGRVLSRWHNEPGDEIPGTYNATTGYYEAMWGYTVDSQTGYVINVCEQFDNTGDVKWLEGHKKSCESALNWLIRRDENNNGIFEMVNRNIAEKKASDWIDIVWAGYENAFVNAQMYAALQKWVECERILGDHDAAKKYRQIALRLKNAFNRPVEEGGFWSEEKKQYIYWRDDDGSIHGDNLVTPVNFMAIGFDICDDPQRIKSIVEQIEKRTSAENLFHWPLCFDSFREEEVHRNNWPFPKYENGDIFPTWGYLGVRSYVKYDKQLALKYVSNLLHQYEQDGLSSQRYSRTTGKGLGTDILSGICTGITALYTDIYGIRPRWNRLVITPGLTKELDGTKFSYPMRNNRYDILLYHNQYNVSDGFHSVTSNSSFGISSSGDELRFFPGDQDTAFLSVKRQDSKNASLNISQWDDDGITFILKDADQYYLALNGLQPSSDFSVSIGKKKQKMRSGENGALTFKALLKKNMVVRIVKL
ncbi:MAG: hypothetical protein BGP13_21980 [Sphingobacteriales bacterium 40-81]|nr:MAG: hypothetical protein BGP13_21980 [Sphingobacteriales bacterium 40-81]